MKILTAMALYLLMTGIAVGQQSEQIIRANQGTVGVITGMEGGTYAQTGSDLTILDDGTLRVLTIIGKGSLQNLSDILYLRGVDIGFVQADALTYAKQHNLFPGLTQNVRYISKLYDEEVHILARAGINRLEDLNGQRVNVDVSGSGSAMTSEIVLDALGIKPKLEHIKQSDALEALKRGEFAAVIHVGGAPIPLFGRLSSDGGMHFLPLELNQGLAETYIPDRLTHDTYPSLISAEAPVPTLAVGDVMAVFAWPAHTERYNKVTRFIDALFGRFDEFLKAPRHPKWREVNLAAEVPGWTRFQAAQDWLARHPVDEGTTVALKTKFSVFLVESGVNATLADSARQALFEQFLAWSRQRSNGH